MTPPGAPPLLFQIVLALVLPGAVAAGWKFLARGWAHGVQGSELSEATLRRQRLEFRVLLAVLYSVAVVGIIIAVAKHMGQ